MSHENEYVQTVELSACTDEMRLYFHTYRRCPECGKEMVTDGKGRFLCDHCKHRDRQEVEHLRPALGYRGKSSGWRDGFTFGRAERLDAIEHS